MNGVRKQSVSLNNYFLNGRLSCVTLTNKEHLRLYMHHHIFLQHLTIIIDNFVLFTRVKNKKKGTVS